jgi:hypothetical protein
MSDELRERLQGAWKGKRTISMPMPNEPGKRVVGYVIEWDKSFPLAPGIILESLSDATAGGEYVLVPREPTEAMIEAAIAAVAGPSVSTRAYKRKIYKAMLAAATASSPVVAQGNITFDELMAQQTPEVRVAIEVERERDLLANAIRSAAVKAGIVDPDAPLTGPQLLMLCDNLATAPQASAEGADGLIRDLIAECDRAVKQAGGDGPYETCFREVLQRHALTAKPAPEGGEEAPEVLATIDRAHDNYMRGNIDATTRDYLIEKARKAAAQPVQEGR